jgi:hypothetical protein
MAPTLETLWRDGRDGYLSPLEQVKAIVYRDVYLEQGEDLFGMMVKIAEKLTKIGGGSPSREAVRALLERYDADPDWYPGKSRQSKRGPAPALSGGNRHAIARSAMALKSGGQEPTYSLVVAAAPRAVLNPATKAPVGKKRVYDVMRAECYDDDADEPWAHRARLQKTSLPPPLLEKRLAWATEVQALAHEPGWYARHVIWTDLCNTILPRTEAKANDQALARKGRKGWMSPGSQEFSRNLRGKSEALKQNSWDAERVWWAPFLVRGKLHVELLPHPFPGECPEGAAMLVSKIDPMLNARFPGQPKPRILFTDRGRGFYHPGTGAITGTFATALRRAGFRPFAGDDAARQPGQLQDVLLHETAVAWLRHFLALSTPRQPWLETRQAYGDRLKEACRKANASYNVEDLCGSFVKRVNDVVARKGDRLKH